MKKKILITGAAGFIGSNLVRKLINDKGNEVHVIIRNSSNLWRLKGMLNSVKKHVVDLLELDKLKRCLDKIKPDFIIHTAVYGGATNEKDVNKIIKTNLFGTMNLLEASKNIDYKCFINTGSSSEYGRKEKPMKEIDFLEPNNEYGISKSAATLYCSYFAKKYKKPIITLRLFSPFGCFDNKDRLISKAIVKALKNENLDLTNPNIERDYLFVGDILDAYIKVMDSDSIQYGEIFNVGSGVRTKISEVIKNIIQLTNSKSKINWDSFPLREYDTKTWVADIKKIKKTFIRRPKHNLKQGLKKTVDWFETYLKTSQ
jgi:nucleoside-diphosphate-sugar epimerase